MVFTGTGSLDIAFVYLATYVFGSPAAAGLFLLTLLFVGLVALRVEFLLALVALIPMNVILFANGAIYPMAAGLHIIIVFIGFGIAFMNDKS